MIPILFTPKDRTITYEVMMVKEGQTYPVVAHQKINQQIINKLNQDERAAPIKVNPDPFVTGYTLSGGHTMHLYFNIPKNVKGAEFDSINLVIRTANRFHKKKDKNTLEAMLPKGIQLNLISDVRN